MEMTGGRRRIVVVAYKYVQIHTQITNEQDENIHTYTHTVVGSERYRNYNKINVIQPKEKQRQQKHVDEDDDDK